MPCLINVNVLNYHFNYNLCHSINVLWTMLYNFLRTFAPMEKLFSDLLESLYPWIAKSGPKILIILIGGFVLHKIAYRFVAKTVRIAVKEKNHSSSEAEKQREDTLIQIFSTTIRIAILITAIMMILPEFKIEIGPILAAAGVVGLALGFGGQYLIRDVITGLFIIQNQDTTNTSSESF